MNDLVELVDLPDPSVQQLVHPLDLAPARSHFRRWWLVGALTSPPVALCLAALLWFASQSYVVSVIVGLAIIASGALAGRCLEDEAWAFIPRKRQDHGRRMPISWELGQAALLATLWGAVLLLVAYKLGQLQFGQPDAAPFLRAFLFGMGEIACLLEVGKVVDRIVWPRAGGRGEALQVLPGAVVAVGCVVVAYHLLFGQGGPSSVAVVGWGAVVMSVMAMCTEVARRAGVVR
ncbi:MAG: hypothetical protein J2P45_13880 [Candidatus Dormibacteraeota bacterium]|nr:hypothetical protein [Candidatus Dormibacteraeota bacterium]